MIAYLWWKKHSMGVWNQMRRHPSLDFLLLQSVGKSKCCPKGKSCFSYNLSSLLQSEKSGTLKVQISCSPPLASQCQTEQRTDISLQSWERPPAQNKNKKWLMAERIRNCRKLTDYLVLISHSHPDTTIEYSNHTNKIGYPIFISHFIQSFDIPHPSCHLKGYKKNRGEGEA
jgi:hypothetical protein